MAQDLHSFLSDFEQRFPNEVLHIEQPISNRFEVTALISKLEKEKRFPVLIFHNIMVDGVKAELPLVTFLLASRKRLAQLLDTSIQKVGVEFYRRIQALQEPVVVSKAEAPVKEMVQRGSEIDLRRYPALVHHYMDPGPYITAGFFTVYDPETGIPNCAFHRGWIKDRDEVRFYLTPSTHNGLILEKHEREGRDMRVAYWIGHHPLAVLGAETHVPLSVSHYAAAGGLLGEPLRLVPSETLGDDFLVPADAEVIIEGIMPCGERRPEGPFGEYPRHVGPQRWNPYFKVTAVTRRKNAYWDDTMLAHTHWLSSFVNEGVVYQNVKANVPTLKNVHVPMSGCGLHHVYLQIENRLPGISRQALAIALTSNFLIKHAFIFDEDVDIFDDREVLWALSTRFQGDQDLVILPGMAGPTLDPSASDGVGTKVGFDCTKPPHPEPFSERTRVPQEVMDRVQLEDYIDREQCDQIPVEPWG